MSMEENAFPKQNKIPDVLPNRPMTLEERYDYIISESIPLEERWPNPPQVIVPFLQRIKKLGVILLADHPKWDEHSKNIPRLGSAVIVPNRQTLIWINLVRHYFLNNNDINVMELIDTIIHEAVHTTGVALGRFVIQPEDVLTDAYRAEEVCARAGASAVHRDMRHDFLATRNKRAAQDEASKLTNPSLRRPAIEQGNKAAQFLLASSAGPCSS